MRIRIQHKTSYAYGQPTFAINQALRLTPRQHDGQSVQRWQIDVNHDCRLKSSEDTFGNIVHHLSLGGPIADLEICVDGEVETQDTHGLVQGTLERFPHGLYLRETTLTRPSAAIAEFARDRANFSGADRLELLHGLLIAIHNHIGFEVGSTEVTCTAAEAFALKRGVCQDLAHIFIACARHLGIPARYVAGYLFHSDGTVEQEAGHAWAEAHVENLGWVGFDPANGICPTEAYVRVAVGLDYLGAAPIRGTRLGGASETLQVAVLVDQAMNQRQS